MNWININNEKPENERRILVAEIDSFMTSNGLHTTTRISIARYVNSEYRVWCFEVDNDNSNVEDTDRNVSYWMPLPNKPTN